MDKNYDVILNEIFDEIDKIKNMYKILKRNTKMVKKDMNIILDKLLETIIERQGKMFDIMETRNFFTNDDIKIIAATNRVDILDSALLRSGRLDRKIEFPLPNVEGRNRILQIHARKMTVNPNVNFDELARSTEGFNGAQCKAVCVEAGMAAIRKGKNEIAQNEFIAGISEVMSKKKSNIVYFT